jgi:thiamine pyrophosphate-dependent acetolactate synthase large subunit-like protein
MADTAAEILIDKLIDWNVDTVFGLPGDGINGLMEALRKRQDQVRFIQVRHEEAAAFMACGYAKYTGHFIGAGRAFRRVAGQRHAEREKDRLDCFFR